MTPTAKIVLLGSAQLRREFMIAQPAAALHAITCTTGSTAHPRSRSATFQCGSSPMLIAAAFRVPSESIRRSSFQEIEAIRTQISPLWKVRDSIESPRRARHSFSGPRRHPRSAHLELTEHVAFCTPKPEEEAAPAVAALPAAVAVKPYMSSSGKGHEHDAHRSRHRRVPGLCRRRNAR